MTETAPGNHILSDNITDLSDLPDHLDIVMNKCKDNLIERQDQVTKDLSFKYTKAFARSINDLGRTEIIRHRINTGMHF